MSRDRRPAARTRICLACRTLFDANQSCPGGGAHKTVTLREPRGRSQLADEVWGPDSRARKARQAAKAGASGAGFGSMLEGCGGCEVGGFDAGLLGIVLAAGVAILLFWLVRWVVRWVRAKMDRPKPHGALAKAPRPKARALAGSGVVRGGTPMALPWAAGSAFAYAMELYEARPFGGGAMLREAVSAELEIALDDGRTVRIPAGRIRVLDPLPAVDGERMRLEGHLGGLVPRSSEGEASLFPFDHVRARTLGPGDRVELFGELTPAPDGAASGYRIGGGVLEPVDVPVLRIVSGPRVPDDPRQDLDEEAEAEAEAANETEVAQHRS